MEDAFELVERPPKVEELRRLRAAVGWSELPSDSIAAGLAGSLFSCVILRSGDVVACGRVIGDGGMYFYVQDVIVMPELHGRGLGARVMDAVIGYLTRVAKDDAFVGLMAAAGVEAFYERYGFVRRPNERPGMFRIWRTSTR